MKPSEILSIPGFAEPVSSLSHLVGAMVFACLAIFLLRHGNAKGKRLPLGVFALTCIFLLILSAIYHLSTPGGVLNDVFQRLDHAAIFVFIAGTFTPVHALLFSGFLRWGMLSIVWAIAATGVTIKTAFFTAIPEAVSLAMYLGLGWLGLVAGIALWKRYGFGFIKPLVWGGIAYTAGSILEFAGGPVLVPGVIGPHELFHFAVLTGIAFHWWFVHNASVKTHVVSASPRPR
ncbi:MAG: hemolysin III family protein [Pseudomonadota bacterium]